MSVICLIYLCSVRQRHLRIWMYFLRCFPAVRWSHCSRTEEGRLCTARRERKKNLSPHLKAESHRSWACPRTGYWLRPQTFVGRYTSVRSIWLRALPGVFGNTGNRKRGNVSDIQLTKQQNASRVHKWNRYLNNNCVY